MYDPAIPLLGIYPIKNIYPHKNLPVNIHNSIIHNSPKGETTKKSTHLFIGVYPLAIFIYGEWIDTIRYKQTTMYLLFNKETGWHVLQHGRPVKTLQVREARQKVHILWLHEYDMLTTGKSIETQTRLVAAWGWEREQRWLQIGTRGHFGATEMF